MIDNTKYYNASLAYDFAMFEEKPKKKDNPDNIVKVNKITEERHKREKKEAKAAAIKKIFAGFLLLGFLFGNIQLKLMINETNDRINKIKTEIKALESEETALQMEYMSKVSYANIELEATQLGMTKASKDQIKYIRVHDENTFIPGD